MFVKRHFIFSSARLCQQSSWNRNSSVVPPSLCVINYLWTYWMDCFQILVLAFAGPYAQTYFEFLKKKTNSIFYEYFSFSLTWDPMGAKISKRYSCLKSLLNLFKPFLIFLLGGPHQSTVFFLFFFIWIFEILSFWFLTNFWNSPLYPMGKTKTSIIWKTSNRRAKHSAILASGVSVQCIQVTLDT